MDIPGGGGERRGWGRGKINPETTCNFMTPVCPVCPVSSSTLYPFGGQCAPESIANISAPNLWNELTLQTSCNTHPVCLLRTNPMAITGVEGMWGGLRVREETRGSLVTLYKHRDGAQTTGCTHTNTHNTPHKDTCSQHQDKQIAWISEPTPLFFPERGVGSATLPCATRGRVISFCSEPWQHRTEEGRRGKRKSCDCKEPFCNGPESTCETGLPGDV